MIGKEFRKIIGIPFVIFFMMVMLFLNGYILKSNSIVKTSDDVTDTVYNKIEGDITQEKVDYISDNYFRLKHLFETKNYKTNGTDENTISGYVVEDFCVFEKCYEHIKYCVEYEKYVKKMCENAEKNITIVNGNTDEVYYKNIIKTYSGRSINSIADTYGNDVYLEYEYSFFFSICMIIIMGTYIIFYERENHMGNIIFSTVYGRYRLIVAKIVVMFIMCFLCILAFRLEDSIIIGIKYGFHGITFPAYVSQDWRYIQFDLSYIQLFLYDIFAKFLVLCFVAIITLVVAVNIKKSSVCIILSVGTVFMMIASQIFVRVEYLPIYFANALYVQKFRCINILGNYVYGYKMMIVTLLGGITVGIYILYMIMRRRNIYATE